MYWRSFLSIWGPRIIVSHFDRSRPSCFRSFPFPCPTFKAAQVCKDVVLPNLYVPSPIMGCHTEHSEQPPLVGLRWIGKKQKKGGMDTVWTLFGWSWMVHITSMVTEKHNFPCPLITNSPSNLTSAERKKDANHPEKYLLAAAHPRVLGARVRSTNYSWTS